MSIPLFLPIPRYLSHLQLMKPITLSQLCEQAGVRCRASGSWTDRQVEVLTGAENTVLVEPGSWGAVRIVLDETNKLARARIALAIMAYSLHDLVARESIKGAGWSRIAQPRGRPKTGKALTNSERQRRFRAFAR